MNNNENACQFLQLNKLISLLLNCVYRKVYVIRRLSVTFRSKTKMKKTFALVLLFVALHNFSFAQAGLQKTWIGEKLDYWQFSKKKATCGLFWLSDYKYKYSDSIVTLRGSNLIIGADGFFPPGSHTFPFKVLKLTEDSLIVTAMSDEAKKLIHNQTTYSFVDKTKLQKEDFIFQGLSFRAYGDGRGTASKMDVEIDATGKVYFLGKANTGQYTGYYQGQLLPQQLVRLVTILKSSGLSQSSQRFPFSSSHGSPYFLNVQFNQTECIREGEVFPYVSRELITYLLNITQEASLNKMEATHKFAGIFEYPY